MRTAGRTEGRMDGWTDGRMDGWTDGRMDGWTDGRMDGWTDGRMDGWTDGRMDGWTDGRMDGWTEWTGGQVDGWTGGRMDGGADDKHDETIRVLFFILAWNPLKTKHINLYSEMSDTEPQPAKKFKFDEEENDGSQGKVEDFSADFIASEMSNTVLQSPKKIKFDEEENNGGQPKMEDFSADLVNNKDEFSMSHDGYIGNEVNPEELEKLKEFQILDEVKSNDEDSEAGESDTSDGNKDFEARNIRDKTEIPDEEIEKMLEEDLPEDFKAIPKPKEKLYVIRQKTVLEVLPLDWVMVRHLSGMPVYLHKPSRVCTLSKPYFIGQKGSAIKHEIPISAIPCLNYKRALEEEIKQKEIDRRIAEQIKQMTDARNFSEIFNNNANNNVPRNIEDNMNSIACNDINARKENASRGNISGMAETERATENELLEIKFNIEDETGNSIVTQNASNGNVTKIEEYQAVDVPPKLTCPFSNASVENSEITVGKMECESNDASSQELAPSNEMNCKQNCDEKPADEDLPLSSKPVILPGGIIMPPPRVETVNNDWKTQPLTHEQVNEYCRRLFQFKTINMMQFKHWVDRHKYIRMRKALPYSTLPQGTKVITIPAKPVTSQENGANGAIGKANRRDWVMNMNGRSYLCVFHEYVQRALQKQPVYEFKQIENASTPYQATVFIGGMQYGVGYGSSKRQAKSAAARASIHILIPEMKDKLDDEEPTKKSEDDPVFSEIFQNLFPNGIYPNDVYLFSVPTFTFAEQSPARSLTVLALKILGLWNSVHLQWNLRRMLSFELAYCVILELETDTFSVRHAHARARLPHAFRSRGRLQAAAGRDVELRGGGRRRDMHVFFYRTKKLEHQRIELTMKVGKHSATVVCKNKKMAKQRASQAILQALHPHVHSWGSLLRLYGSRSVKSSKEKKLEEQQITLLQDKARHNEPNYAVLEKLRQEMRRLKERDEAVVPIGTLLVTDDLPTHSGSNLNNVDL
ncbi:Microprocessor complex subunit DGCR8 [Eumeta japonica]|uniref:Microprocessor complex subunit DGCR8 n=1 Tax=Eumeta variegata TaxID=151549 RepID=A0A4C1YJS8_EUMVA|nr:Microprocessor complex subunit DGCR8 [Eumeta japonica]